jgi:hypothetical protein
MFAIDVGTSDFLELALIRGLHSQDSTWLAASRAVDNSSMLQCLQTCRRQGDRRPKSPKVKEKSKGLGTETVADHVVKPVGIPVGDTSTCSVPGRVPGIKVTTVVWNM